LNFPFYIARRYLFARKTHNIINIISLISVAGIAMGTMALVIVLSVFNGFENLVTTLFNTFNPDIRITAVHGKTFYADSLPADAIRNIPGVLCVTEVIEENGLLKYRDKQFIVTIKGVGKEFHCTSHLCESMVEGDCFLGAGGGDYAVVGQGIAYNLGLVLNDFENPLSLYVPRRSSRKTLDITDAFNVERIQPSGFFGIQQDFDMRFVIVPLKFARRLLDHTNRLTALEIHTEAGAGQARIQKEIERTAGPEFSVKNRFQQEEWLFRIMKSEKLAVFTILSFILLIAAFNVIGSLSMLILDKKKDIFVLKSLGASDALIRRIFRAEGLLISFSGALIGLFLGFLICFLQMQFGIITIQNSGSFLVDAYPVNMQAGDFVLVLLLNLMIGFFAAWYPVKYISKKFFREKA
jgi:lipoprotein-releasing system permease protein